MILMYFPRAKALLKQLRDLFGSTWGISSRYVEVRGDIAARESTRLRGAWQADVLPGRQRQLVERQLAEFRRGAPIDVFDIMLKALRELPESAEGMSLLEVGCSSGYYAELFEIAGIGVAYTGCDYSDAFITMARQKYPHLRFDVRDATSLHYADNQFNIVMSGGCLLHVPEYERAVAETARVAQQYAIFHRTPVVFGQPERRYRKLAYGVEMVEIHFNEPQFLALLAHHRLEAIRVYTMSESLREGVGDAQRTYVCRKIFA